MPVISRIAISSPVRTAATLAVHLGSLTSFQSWGLGWLAASASSESTKRNPGSTPPSVDQANSRYHPRAKSLKAGCRFQTSPACCAFPDSSD